MAETPLVPAPPRRSALRRRREWPEPDAREGILRAFAERARRTGIRGVVLGDLAAELGISKKTLYQHFESKQALVQALVEKAVARLRSDMTAAARRDLHGADVLRGWVASWLEGFGRFSPEFWRELERDYPGAWAVFRTVNDDAGRRAHARIGRDLRAGVHPEVARELFHLFVRHFTDPVVTERLGLTRREAALAALEIWIGGALGARREG